MRRPFRLFALKLLIIPTVFIGAAPSHAQTLLQDLDPGSVTEGAFADLFYYPEPKIDDRYATSRSPEPSRKSTAKNKNRSYR